ncbi:hypothetical protein IMCC21906_02015 [Spongiibacter sp. IMCC21906]|nr:hypothetical protein IMCC21906_02015 [Spongiibacter sp. IMCC21906]
MDDFRPVADLQGWGDKRLLLSERQKGRESGLFYRKKARLDIGG